MSTNYACKFENIQTFCEMIFFIIYANHTVCINHRHWMYIDFIDTWQFILLLVATHYPPNILIIIAWNGSRLAPHCENRPTRFDKPHLLAGMEGMHEKTDQQGLINPTYLQVWRECMRSRTDAMRRITSETAFVLGSDISEMTYFTALGICL